MKQIERLRDLAQRAAETARKVEAEQDEQMREALINTGLFLARRKLFPEAAEPSPFGRLQMLPNGMARIIRPGS